MMALAAVGFLLLTIIAISREKPSVPPALPWFDPETEKPDRGLAAELEAMDDDAWKSFRANEHLAMAKKRQERLQQEISILQAKLIIAGGIALAHYARARRAASIGAAGTTRPSA